MADSILKIRTQDGDKPIGYPGLADKPVANKTLDIEGAFADAKVVGDKFKEVKAETDSLKEDIDGLENLKYRELYDNLFYDFFAIATKKSGEMTEYGNAQHMFITDAYSDGLKLESGNYLVAIKITNVNLKRQANTDSRFAVCIIDGWKKNT